MGYKSIEVYYSVASIPGVDIDDPAQVLDFRNAAMEVIETALEKEGAGEWVGAEIGMGLESGELEVNFGFEVQDFEKAEAIVRKAVEGTEFAGIREITRFEGAN